jgi:uncharacterized membrane protein
MSLKRYRILTAITLVIVAASVGWAVVNGNAWIPIPIFVAALLILLLSRRRVREIVVDERVYSIAEKASYLAFRIFGIAAAVIGATLVAIGWDSSSALYKIGLTLTFAACGLMMIYYIAYIYYNKKHSGKK